MVSLIGIPALAMDLIERAKKRHGFSQVDEFWPDLRFFIYGGVALSADQKAQLVRDWFGRDYPFHFVETYMTTEGGMAFSDDPSQEGMVLNTLENLYLFYLGDRAYFAHELEVGKRYVLSVTTPGGLVNYKLGDIIEVCSTRPLRIKVIGREKEEISMTGEKISLSQIELAAKKAGIAPSTSSWPIVWVEQSGKPHLVWGLPESCDPSRLDRALCEINTLYAESLVHEKVIGPSRVVQVPLSVFKKYIDANLGIAQFKPKKIFNSLEAMSKTYDFKP